MSAPPATASNAALALAGSPEKPVASYEGFETIARIAPVRGSRATTAPRLVPSCAAAKSSSRWSMVNVKSTPVKLRSTPLMVPTVSDTLSSAMSWIAIVAPVLTVNWLGKRICNVGPIFPEGLAPEFAKRSSY